MKKFYPIVRRKFRWELLLITLLLTFLVPSISKATSYNTNIVTNGDAETTGFSGWTGASIFIQDLPSNLSIVASPNGGNVFDYWPSSTGSESLTQTIDISDLSTDLSNGKVKAILTGQVFVAKAAGIARIIIEQLNASNGILASSQVENSGVGSYGSWETKTITIDNLNTSTRKLKITLYASITSNDPSADFDGIDLKLYKYATVTTTAAAAIATTSATLGGNVTVDGSPSVTERGVVYSTTNATPTIGEANVTKVAIGSGSGDFSQSIGSLTGAQLYYFNTYATNTAGTVYGTATSFTTLPPPTLTATTNDATSVTINSAALNGAVNANGNTTNCYFQYGTTASYGTQVAASPATATGTSATTETVSITGLSNTTTYHFRMAAYNATEGWKYGDDKTFTTATPVSEIDLKQSTTAIADGGSYDFGYHQPSTNTDIIFTIENTGTGELTLTTPISIGGANADQFSIQSQPSSPVAVSGSTTFTVRFTPTSIGNKTATISIANNDSDENPYDLTIAGAGYLSATVTTNAANYYTQYPNGIISTGMTLNGTVNANNNSTAVTFEYGLTTSYGASVTASQSPVTGTSATSVSYNLTGLALNTQYHYRVVGTNLGGTVYGDDQTFTTCIIENFTDETGETTTFAEGGATFTTTGYLKIANIHEGWNGSTVDDYLINTNLTFPPAAGVFGSIKNGSNNFYANSFWVAPGVQDGLGVVTIGQYGDVIIRGKRSGTTLFTYTLLSGSTNVTVSQNYFTFVDLSSYNTILVDELEIEVTNDIRYMRIDAFNFNYPAPFAPTVTTQAVSNIGSTNAIGNGNITDLGNPNPTAYGICYGATLNPTISGSKVDKGAATVTGAFTAQLTGLTPGTTYHARAFATNSVETVYGDDVTFTPLNTISSIVRAATSPTNSSSVSWTVTFAASVTGLTSSNFSLANTSLTSPSITNVTGSGTTWTVTANTGSGSGSLGLNIANSTDLNAGFSNSLPFTGEVYTIDKTAPAAPTISGISSGYFNTNQSFTLSGEAGASIEYSTNNGGAWTAYSGAVTLSAEGTYNVLARQTDQAGNGPTATSSAITLTIDKTAPAAPTISGISAGNFNTNQSFTVSGEAGATLEYSTNNGGAWTAYSSAVTLSSEGTYNVLARQTDQASNGPTASSAITLTIDKTAPAAPTISGISAGYFNTNQTFTVSGEAGATIEYSTNNGGAWSAYSGAVTISAEDTYNVLARQTDQAGNGPTATSSAITLTIDKTAPAAPTISGISAGYFNTNQSFTVSGEAGATLEYSTNNGGAWTAYSSAVTLSSEGTYNVLARQTDQASNGPTASSAITLAIDKTPLTLSSTSPLDDATNAYLCANIVLTFDDNIVIGSGNITIRRSSDDGIFEQIPIGDSRIDIVNNVVTIDLTGTFAKGTGYYVEVDGTALNDDAGNSYAGISGSTTLNFTTVDVVINEVVTDPQRDWNTFGFTGIVGAGAVTDYDEWIELYINTTGINFSGWTIELMDGTNIIGNLSALGAFVTSRYLGIGNFTSTISGDYLVLGRGNGSPMNNDITINLKDPSGATVDAVTFNSNPSSNSDDQYNETAQRFPNGTDTNTASDWTQGEATLGTANSGPSVKLSVSPSSIGENAVASTITTTLCSASTQITTITISKSGTATLATDYTLSSTSIVIPAGSTTGTATVTSIQDPTDEVDETVTLDITTVTNGKEAGTQQQTITITDDNDPPLVTLSVSPSTIAENDVPETSTITAILAVASGKTVTVTISASSLNAVNGTDYSLSSTTITILPGSLTGTATISSIQDPDVEGHQTIDIDITGVINCIEDGIQQETIQLLDDEIATVSSVSSSTANGAYKAGGVIVVTVNFSYPVDVTGTPQLTLETGTTDRVINYTGGSGSTALTFSYTIQPSDESADLDYVDINSLSANGGTIRNSGLDAILTLPTPGAAGSLSANMAIVIDNTPPTTTVTLSDYALKAGETATVTITFSEAVTGFDNTDLVVPNGTLTPVASTDGDITFTGTFTPTADFEDATNIISLDNILVADLAGNAGTGTTSSSNFAIDTKIPVVANVTSTKINGTYGIGETILISVEFDQTVTVTGTPQLRLETGIVDRTIDYVSGTNTNTLVFSYTAGAGDESADLDYNATSSLTLNGGTIADAAGNNAIRTLPAPGAAGSLGANKALVIQAFPLVTLGVGSTSIDENGGTTSITATLSEISTQDVVVSVSYSGSAANGTDYNNTASTSITVPAGSTSASAVVGITATDDDIVETNETIIIDITSISKGFEDGAQQQTVTITEDDQAIISIEATTQASEDATNGVFTISVDKELSTDLTVNLTLSGTAANGTDMNTMATSVVIPAGSFSVTTPVTLINDAIAEGSETVILTLGTNTGAPTGATVSNSPTDNEATVTITDNDLAVVVSIAATTQAAEDATNGLFTISVDKKLSTSLTVNLISSGTATDGVDMNTMATSVVIPAGDFSVTTPVSVISDNLVEGNETVIYILGTKSGAPTGVTVTNSLTADKDTVTITDDDLATLRVTRKANAYENVSDGAFYVITNKRFDSDVNVGVSVGGTATAGTDYTAIVSPQLFPANTDTLTVTVAQLDDSESEINEYVILNLVSTNNARVSIAPAPDYTAVVTFLDDDQPLVVLSQSVSSFSESGGKNAITATLNKVHHTDVVVTLATTGTSTPGNDFSSLATITVPAGNLSATDTLRAIQDQLVEADETVVIDILSITNGVENGTQQVSSTIIDDDEAVLSISSAKNGKEGSSNAVFHVVTDKLIDSGVTVNVATSGTATEGVDYATFGGAITFPAYTDTLDVSVLITNDIDTEDAESVIMILTGTNNADVTIASAPNHRDTVTIIDDDIRQLVIANTVLTTSKIFDGNDIAKVVVGTLTNLIPGDNIVLKAEAHYDNADAGNKKKITIHYTVTGEDSIKYFAPVDSVYLKGLIEQGNLNIFAESKTMRYGDSIPELTLRYDFFDTVGTVSGLDHKITAWLNTDSITGPGTYPIHISGGKDNNYAIFYFEGTLTIEKALLKVTAQDDSITYGEPLPELAYTIEGFLNGDNDSVLSSMPTIAAATGAGENAGVFAIMPSGGSDEFYDFDYQNGKLMVAKAMLTATASDMVSSVGTIPQLTVGYAGFVKGDTSSELDTLPVATTTATKDSPSGAYPIKVSGGYDNNYNFTYVGGELTLASKANPTITWNTPSDIVYGELLSEKQLNATCNAYGTLVYEPAAGTLLGAGDMQELKVTFIPKDTINVNKASATVHIDVERATITVTANDKTITYGEILPVLSFSYSAFMNGENASVLDKRPSASTMVGVTDAGTYPIVLFGGEDDNYKFEYINGELTIEKAKLTVDVADCEMFEGDALPVFALSYSGFISGESATVLDTLPKATTQVTTESAPGIYEVIAAGGKDNNYSFVYEKGNLTVKAKQHPVVTWANPSDITYGTVLGATQLNAKANIAGTFTYTPSTGTVLAAGKSQLVIARFTPTDIANYAVVTDTALINVSKAPLTVTADDAEMKAGETMPEFTMSYAGFVNGDDKSDIDKQPVATSTASSTSEKGEYEITVSGGEDNNYSFAYANGTLTIKSGDAVKVIEAMSLSVYPNPFTDQVSITADYKGLGSYQLSDITGKVIEQGNIANGTGNLKLSHIRSGIYLLQVKMGEGCKSFRLIKR